MTSVELKIILDRIDQMEEVMRKFMAPVQATPPSLTMGSEERRRRAALDDQAMKVARKQQRQAARA